MSSDLFSGDLGLQIKARTKVYEMKPFSIGSEAARDERLDLVLGLESLLPLANHPCGSLEGEAHYLYHRSGGSIGSLRGLLGDAAIMAIQDGTEKVSRRLLDSIITDSSVASPPAKGPATDAADHPGKRLLERRMSGTRENGSSLRAPAGSD